MELPRGNKGAIITEEGRTCHGCGEFKPWSEFHKHNGKTGKHESKCKVCKSTHMKLYRKSKPEIRLDKYGLTVEDEARMILAQAGRCAICKDEFIETPHIDHCHETLRVRGLLCDPCNVGLGFFRDDPMRLQGAVVYLSV